MNVTYTPAGDAPQVWEFNPKLVLTSMAEVIEKKAGANFEQWVDAVLSGSAKARRVLLWHLICRTHGHVRFEDVPDFAMGELVVERDLGELIEFRGVIESWKGDEDLRARGLEEIDGEIERAREAGAVTAPKAISNDDELSTPSTSPTSSD